ncbi:MAG: hypothetical protein H7X92_14330 [Chitinophagales bacterium]|nr:hypothetical protein [Hyphomicrobiales bacterium]
MVTFIIVPQGLAFALLLRVPPVMGLYSSLVPLVVFAIFAKGRFVSPGPTPAAALATLALFYRSPILARRTLLKRFLPSALLRACF